MDADRDTIAAIATAPGRGGVGIVRASGPLAAEIARQLLRKSPTPRHAHFLTLVDAEAEAIDNGLLLFFPGPRSFTGEDVLELQLHGSPIALALAQRRLHELGCRPARPGEFSERAFLNGRIDLTQAEAIADLIASRSESSLRAAQRSLSGVFSERVNELLERLIQARVHVEAAIDFPEEEIDFLSDGQILARIDGLIASLQELNGAAQRGQRLNDGLQLLILGAPNTGKSSLLNQLSGSDSAIVTDIPGTTRDLLREHIELDGVLLTLIDSAGLRASSDPVELEGQRRARRVGDIVGHRLMLVDDSRAEESLQALADPPGTSPCSWLFNKIDLSGRAAGPFKYQHEPAFAISVKTGAGMAELRQHLHTLAGGGEHEGSFSARQRHLDALSRVANHLDQARMRLIDERAGELVAEELRLAQDALASITGTFGADDLLGEIFGSFCIGK